MADYRGGGWNESKYGDNLTRAIRDGRTERQYQRNLREKLIFTGIQGALTAARGVGGYIDHKNQVAKANAQDQAHYAATPAPDYKPMAAAPTDAHVPDWLNGGQGDRTELAMDNSVLQAAMAPDTSNPYGEDPMTAQAKAMTAAPGRRGMMGSQ